MSVIIFSMIIPYGFIAYFIAWFILDRKCYEDLSDGEIAFVLTWVVSLPFWLLYRLCRIILRHIPKKTSPEEEPLTKEEKFRLMVETALKMSHENDKVSDDELTRKCLIDSFDEMDLNLTADQKNKLKEIIGG